MSNLVDLAKGVTAELKVLLAPIQVDRRYMPRTDVADLDDMKIGVYIEGSESDEIARGAATTKRHTLGIAVQQAITPQVPIDADGNPVLDGIDDLSVGDRVLNIIEQIKGYWLPNGVLRDKMIAECQYLEQTHEPVYEVMHLISMGVYTAIIDVTYIESGL